MSNSVQPHRQQPTRLPRPWDSPSKNTGVGCHFLLQCMKVKSESEVAQSCPTLCDPMDCRLPGSSVHGIFQARYYCFCFMFCFFWPWDMWGLSSPTRDWTCTPYIGRWSPNHRTTWEVPSHIHVNELFSLVIIHHWMKDKSTATTPLPINLI